MIRSAVILFALGFTLVPSAHAASDKLRIGIFGSGKGAGPLMTRAELRECLTIESRVVEGSQSALREREQLEKEKAELIRQGEVLKSEFEALDKTSLEALQAHRDKELARDKAIDEFDARSNAFNARIGALEADRATFNQRCDNRRFDQADEAAIRKGK
ncbi:MAG: hypothetical protein AB7U92_25780 [Piscinibacter sp.]|uniref:hypothetical protein n=1 Tax=Piscinibacter sp. TaxID=1903157 RepID=UPI003D1529F7